MVPLSGLRGIGEGSGVAFGVACWGFCVDETDPDCVDAGGCDETGPVNAGAVLTFFQTKYSATPRTSAIKSSINIKEIPLLLVLLVTFIKKP